MNKSLLTLTASAFLLATTLGTAQAQQASEGEVVIQHTQAQQGQQTRQGQRAERRMQRAERRMQRDRQSRMQRGAEQRGRYSDRRRHGGYYGMGRGGAHHGMGMMGHGMGHHAMMQVVFALMDADGDGTLSLEEVQEAHARIFAHMDADGDGQLTKEEIRAFFHGGKDRRADRRDRSEMTDDMDDTNGLNLSDEVGDDDDDDNN